MPASWDPLYRGEKVDFYHDYMLRHAPMKVSHFHNRASGLEVMGMGLLYNDSGTADKLFISLVNGSIRCAEASATHDRLGHRLDATPVGRLTGSRFEARNGPAYLSTGMGTAETVSIDSRQKRGFFVYQRVVNEVDLCTLQVVARRTYPYDIMALSEAQHPTPLTVGTQSAIYLHDRREPASAPSDSSFGVDRIDDAPYSLACGLPAMLPHPGPLSILHLPTAAAWSGNGDIWVGGSFTSILNYDRRCFPKLKGTIHSGGRLACLSSMPRPFVPWEDRYRWPKPSEVASQQAGEARGHTLLAAGEYKGKGSLELYSLSSTPGRSMRSSDRPGAVRQAYLCSSEVHGATKQAYSRNRQTAGMSKLFAVAPHGTCIVCSDGNGNLTWRERDGSTLVRTERYESPSSTADNAASLPCFSDAVKKITPTIDPSLLASGPPSVPIGHDNLVVWGMTGDISLLGFGACPSFSLDETMALHEQDRTQRLNMHRITLDDVLRDDERERQWLRW